MTDEELLGQSATLPTMYFDGFGAYQCMNGVLRCIGYVLQTGANLNLVVSLTGADQAQIDTARALQQKPTKALRIWSGSKLAH